MAVDRQARAASLFELTAFETDPTSGNQRAVMVSGAIPAEGQAHDMSRQCGALEHRTRLGFHHYFARFTFCKHVQGLRQRELLAVCTRPNSDSAARRNLLDRGGKAGEVPPAAARIH
jgi:hypothetical protein